MRVLFIQKSTGRGGAKNSLMESLTAMRKDGSIQPQVLVGEPGPFVDRCRNLEVPCSIVALPEWRKFFERLRFGSAMKEAAALARDHRPDWIISNEMWWGPHAARIASNLGCRSAVILRDGIATIPKAKQYRLFDNDLILPVSSTIGDALRPDPLFRDRVQILFNSVSVPEGNASQASELDEKLRAYPTVSRWLLVVGKVGARKNQTDAVKTLRLLINDGHRDLGLLLAGDIDPDYAPAMEAAISGNQLTDRVAMIGNFDGLQALLDRTDTVLLPSFREGLPRSLVESITAGKPAFSFPCEGVEDIYGEHLATFVSKESTAASLHAVIQRAWADPVTTGKAFDDVRHKVLARFSPRAHLDRITSLLSSPDGPSRTPSR